ncbi:MAG: hypothetical protein AB7O80_24200, partial [Acetobacteraceae bacterium]
DSRAWLALALGTDADDTAWTAHFSSWAPQRLEPVRQSVAAAMAGMAAEVAEDQGAAMSRAQAALDRWLSQRASDLCGTWQATTPDLFGFTVEMPLWRTHPDPLDRLASFAADTANALDRRQQARLVIAHYAARSAEVTALAQISTPRLMPTGMLMLLPG